MRNHVCAIIGLAFLHKFFEMQLLTDVGDSNPDLEHGKLEFYP